MNVPNLLFPLLGLFFLQLLQCLQPPPLLLSLLHVQLINLLIQHDFLLHEVGAVGFQFCYLLEWC